MLPVKHEGQVVGVVQLMHERSEYDQEQLELAEGLIGLMAAAVGNARLHERAQAEAAARARARGDRRRAGARGACAGSRRRRRLPARRRRDRALLEPCRRARQRASEPGRAGPAGRRGLRRLGSVAAEIPISEGASAPRPVTLPVDVDGRELWLSFVAVRSFAGVVYAFRDLTVERRLEEAQSDFIATVSHELRTPMTAVLGAAKTLLRDDIDAPARAPSAAPRDDQRAGRRGSPRSPRRCCSRAASTAATSGRQRARRPRRAGPRGRAGDAAELPESVSLTASFQGTAAAVGDRDRIQQVLVNLIDNAIKYSPDGGAVKVSTARSDGAVRVEVEDEGIGDPARRAASRSSRSSIARTRSRSRCPAAPASASTSAASSSGGWAGASASARAPGAGSTFSFELPRGLIRPSGGGSTMASRGSPNDASTLLGSADTVPIYEYVCMECESHFEELVRNGEEPDCPDCSASNVRKQFSVFATHGTAAQPTFGGPSSGGGCCGGSCGCG